MVQTVCMPGKFAALCRNLNQRQRAIVKQIGLDCLLSIPSMPIQRMLLESLVEKYNVIDRNFIVHGHNVGISTWDVYCILGLVDKGEKIEIIRKHADRKWFDLYKEKGDTAITFKYLVERIPKEKDADHFSRMFVLYAIGTILAPSSKEFVSSNYLELVVDVSRIKGFNWARFTLDHLLENLAAFKTSKRTGLVGNLALLQVVIHLEPNESKVCPAQESGDQYYEGMRHENFENKDWNENVDQEEVNQGDLHGDSKDDESKMKVHISEVTKGLKLSDLELCAIRFVQEEIAIDPNSKKALVDINGVEITAWHMNCLVRPVKENSMDKWLDSRIIDCYSAMFNSDWNKKKEMKHALNAGQSQWLQGRGQDWIETGKPYWKLSCGVAHDLVRAEMVTIN
ncbi:unnamed protein product [Urochloa decumbens]|uniref:DUF1985 domain-containing protein n=1 Tax=Urochloa decumbens TaxID=240449 RepID=A0ABC9DBQ3_9POAL